MNELSTLYPETALIFMVVAAIIIIIADREERKPH